MEFDRTNTIFVEKFNLNHLFDLASWSALFSIYFKVLENWHHRQKVGGCFQNMADDQEESCKKKCSSLIQAMLPIDGDLQLLEEDLMATKFSQSKHWKSLYIVGPNQIQRKGLLFQVSYP